VYNRPDPSCHTLITVLYEYRHKQQAGECDKLSAQLELYEEGSIKKLKSQSDMNQEKGRQSDSVC
jgi:hypothetical protein